MRFTLLAVSVFVFIVSGFLLTRSVKNKPITSSNKKIAYLDLTSLNKFMRPVDKEDHILGSFTAPVKIVEFSDYQCPFCRKFHPTMKRVVDTYGASGQVAWIYRHFPLEIHKQARPLALASECISELGGNGAFWNFTDKIFELMAPKGVVDLLTLPQIAKDVGINQEAFQSCYDSNKYASRIARDLSDGMTAGGRGTPFVVVVGPNNKRYDFSGAQPYDAVKDLIELALKSK